MREKAYLLPIAILLIIIGLVAWFVGPRLLHPGGREQGTAEIGGPFTLKDQQGVTRTQDDFHGHWMFVFFGFTQCPDMCPTALTTMNAALKLLGKDAKDIRPIFVTLDPARDKPEILKSYLANFSPPNGPVAWTGLTGTRIQIDEAANAFRVYHARQDLPESAAGYTVNHSGFIYLMGPDGGYRAHFRHSDSPEAVAQSLRKTLADD